MSMTIAQFEDAVEINRNNSCIWIPKSLAFHLVLNRLIETIVVFELVIGADLLMVGWWLIETIVVFELILIGVICNNSLINRNNSCIWITILY